MLWYACFVSRQTTKTQLTDIWFGLLGILIRYRSSSRMSDAVSCELSADEKAAYGDMTTRARLLSSIGGIRERFIEKHCFSAWTRSGPTRCGAGRSIWWCERRPICETGRSTCHRLGSPFVGTCDPIGVVHAPCDKLTSRTIYLLILLWRVFGNSRHMPSSREVVELGINRTRGADVVRYRIENTRA